MSESQKNMEKGLNKKFILAAVAVVLLAVVIGAGIYNMPANRLARQLDLGQKYLEEQDYEAAIVAFQNAIAIDDKCMDAYLGCITAYTQSGMTEELSAFYENTLSVITGLEEESRTANVEQIKEIAVSLEEYLNDLLAKKDYSTVEELIEASKDADPAFAYDDILAAVEEEKEKERQYQEVIEQVSGFVDAKDYDGLYSFWKEAYLEWVEACWEWQEAYEEAILDADSSEETLEEATLDLASFTNAWTLAENATDGYHYIPEDPSGQNGVGYGLYLIPYDMSLTYEAVNTEPYDAFGCGGVWDMPAVYYGTYQDGQRSGNGIWIMASIYERRTYVYEGEWREDAPNGYGEVKMYEKLFGGSELESTYSGNLTNGLWDGTIEIKHEDLDESFYFDAVQGTFEDKKEEYLAAMEEKYYFLSEMSDYCCEFDYNPPRTSSTGGAGAETSGPVTDPPGNLTSVYAYIVKGKEFGRARHICHHVLTGSTVGVFGFADGGFGEGCF